MPLPSHPASCCRQTLGGPANESPMRISTLRPKARPQHLPPRPCGQEDKWVCPCCCPHTQPRMTAQIWNASQGHPAGKCWKELAKSIFVQGEHPLVASMGTLGGTPRWVKAGLSQAGQGVMRGRGLEARKGARAGGGKGGKKGQGVGTGGGVRQAWGGRARYPFAGQSERSVGRCHGKPAGWVESQRPHSGQGAGGQQAATEGS